MNKKSPLDSLLDEITPLEQSKTNAKMILAARIVDAMKAKKLNNNDISIAMDKDNPSIIPKWLSGTYNFDVDTLVELETILNISLLNLIMESKEEKKFTYTDILRFAHHLMTNLLTTNIDENGIGEISGEDLVRIQKELNKFVNKE